MSTGDVAPSQGEGSPSLLGWLGPLALQAVRSASCSAGLKRLMFIYLPPNVNVSR